jgi:hypothetical protein
VCARIPTSGLLQKEGSKSGVSVGVCVGFSTIEDLARGTKETPLTIRPQAGKPAYSQVYYDIDNIFFSERTTTLNRLLSKLHNHFID